MYLTSPKFLALYVLFFNSSLKITLCASIIRVLQIRELRLRDINSLTKTVYPDNEKPDAQPYAFNQCFFHTVLSLKLN